MRLPKRPYTNRAPWRIREIAPDFTLEDVWALPAYGDAGGLPGAARGSHDVPATWPARRPPGDAPAVRGPAMLARPVVRLGRWRRAADPGTARSVAGRTACRMTCAGTAAGPEAGLLVLAAVSHRHRVSPRKLSNQTVHGVMHLAWVDRGHGRFQGQDGGLRQAAPADWGSSTMAFIAPVPPTGWVYPALLRQIERAWQAR